VEKRFEEPKVKKALFNRQERKEREALNLFFANLACFAVQRSEV
jgi:hypothetical protein